MKFSPARVATAVVAPDSVARTLPVQATQSLACPTSARRRINGGRAR